MWLAIRSSSNAINRMMSAPLSGWTAVNASTAWAMHRLFPIAVSPATPSANMGNRLASALRNSASTPRCW